MWELVCGRVENWRLKPVSDSADNNCILSGNSEMQESQIQTWPTSCYEGTLSKVKGQAYFT